MFPIIEKIFEATQKKIKSYPCHNIWASQAGSDCERFLVHSVLDDDKKILHSVASEFIFEGGRFIEDIAYNQLKRAGFDIIEQQRHISILDGKITGRLDGMLYNDDLEQTPLEIKGLQSYDWQALNTIEDFHKSKRPWIRKYPAQLMLYMYATNKQKGIFYLVNKQNYQPKVIWMDFDHEYLEFIFEKAKRVLLHIANKTYPDPVEDPSTCKWCSFSHICLPAKDYGDGVQVINDHALLDALAIREANMEAKKGYEEADKYIKSICKEKEYVMAGEWMIEGKWQNRNYKAREAKTTTIWVSKISKLEG